MLKTRRGISLGLLIWIIVGIVVAVVRDYITADDLRIVGSALLAVFLWPLVLLGIDLNLG